MSDLKSNDFGYAAVTATAERKRWTTPRVILSEMADAGSPFNPGALPVDVKGAGTASGLGS
jgi:hypothetical protein